MKKLAAILLGLTMMASVIHAEGGTNAVSYTVTPLGRGGFSIRDPNTGATLAYWINNVGSPYQTAGIWTVYDPNHLLQLHFSTAAFGATGVWSSQSYLSGITFN